MTEVRTQDRGPQARKKVPLRVRIVSVLLIGLFVMDLATLAFAVVVFVRQENVNTEIHDGLCRGNGITINRIVEAQARSNEETFQTFFPDVSPDEIQAALNQQRLQDANQIVDLAEGCDPGQLGSDPKVIADARALAQEDE